MRKRTEEAWKKCPKCGRIENQIKAGYNGSGSQRCKCKECGIYYTVDPKQHAYPEETRKLAIKMYYGGVNGRGVGKILGMNKFNVMNWIKKRASKRRLKRKNQAEESLKLWNWTSCTGFWSPSPERKPGKTFIS